MPARDPITSPRNPSGTGPSANDSSFSAHSPPSGSHNRRTSFSQMIRGVSGTLSSGMERQPSDEEAMSSQISNRQRSNVDSEDRFTGTSLSNSSLAIRDSSARLALASLSFTPNLQGRRSSSIGTAGEVSQSPSTSPVNATRASVDYRPHHPSHLNPSISISNASSSFSPPKDFIPGSAGNVGPSALSMMLNRERAAAAAAANKPAHSPLSEAPTYGSTNESQSGVSFQSRRGSLTSADLEATPVPRKSSLNSEGLEAIAEGSDMDDPNSSSALRRYLASEVAREDVERAGENTPLLGGGKPGINSRLYEFKSYVGKLTPRDIAEAVIVEPIRLLPSTILGLLLNVLDGVSYGMIMFPPGPMFEDFGSLGVSMFFVSCIVSQLVFSFGGSVFAGGNGSMMIECVPFFHILTSTIVNSLGDNQQAIVATTMVSFALSSIFVGLVFFVLGAFRLGGLIGYFPRHILVGCIGGVGIFLLETGLEVSLGLKEEGFTYDLATLKLFFKDTHSILLWTIPLFLAIFLRVITHFFHHQLIFPAYFFTIPVVFYIVVAIAGWSLVDLRHDGWLLNVGTKTQAWWKFYTMFDFKQTSWTTIWDTLPTQAALVFFGILHVPLNVPALGVTLREDNVKLDRELIGHGISNVASGLLGSVPNYLTYVNTVLFYRVGGGSRLSGLLLAIATILVMIAGPTVIGFLPVMLVGALIFVLGIDLVIEAVWDTRHRVNRSEYITIWAIAIGMTLWDFVWGLLFGIVLACIFFVVQNSRRRAIRAVFTGATATSTVRRPRSQRAFIQQVGSQTYILKLQGFLFFGTITTVEDEIRKLLDLAKWQQNPIRFLIIDLHLVHGLDFSSAEAFVRVQRLLAAKDVLLILCGAAPNGPVGPSLQAVDLWSGRDGRRVEVFATLNDALEWTENAYLTAFYENHKSEEEEPSRSPQQIDFPKIAKPPFSLAESFQNSPRRSHLAKAGGDTLPKAPPAPEPESSTFDPQTVVQPLPLLIQTFGSYTEEPDSFFQTLVPYFAQINAPAGQTLWNQYERADGLYLIESGSLRATYAYEDYPRLVSETMVAGTIAGELSTLSDTQRNATAVAERDCVLWKLDQAALDKLAKDEPDVARRFVKIILKAVAEEYETLSTHLIAMLS